MPLKPEQLVAIENELIEGTVSMEKLCDLLDKHGEKNVEKALEELHGTNVRR